MPYKDKERQRQAQREWASRNRTTISRNSNLTRRKHAKIVEDHKDRPCADCGVRYPPYVMDLDHLPGHEKHSTVSILVKTGASKARIMAEMEKCEVVCSNCHRERTYKRRTHSSLA